jgi:hypothetical protein
MNDRRNAVRDDRPVQAQHQTIHPAVMTAAKTR